MSNPLFDIDIKRDGDKVVFDFTKVGNKIFRDFHRKLERICEADFDEAARKLGYIRLADDEVVVKREHLKNCLAALDDTTRAKINPGDIAAYGHIQQALAREVKP